MNNRWGVSPKSRLPWLPPNFSSLSRNYGLPGGKILYEKHNVKDPLAEGVAFRSKQHNNRTRILGILRQNTSFSNSYLSDAREAIPAEVVNRGLSIKEFLSNRSRKTEDAVGDVSLSNKIPTDNFNFINNNTCKLLTIADS
ncbi:unnamed protein product [Trichobilharzia szidati]|nr:unnamed protein product [Trichobilharzia szidati]